MLRSFNLILRLLRVCGSREDSRSFAIMGMKPECATQSERDRKRERLPCTFIGDLLYSRDWSRWTLPYCWERSVVEMKLIVLQSAPFTPPIISSLFLRWTVRLFEVLSSGGHRASGLILAFDTVS